MNNCSFSKSEKDKGRPTSLTMVDPPSPGGRSTRAQGERSMSEERSIQDGPRSGKSNLAYAYLQCSSFAFVPLGLRSSAQHPTLGESSTTELDPSLGLHCLFHKSFHTPQSKFDSLEKHISQIYKQNRRFNNNLGCC